MSKLKVLCFGVSIDGYGAGPRQSMENPMGAGGMALHEWVIPTKAFRDLHLDISAGAPDVNTGIDNDFASRGFENIGAWIMGRNMFGPMRGPWTDHSWQGWWGENPPYHTPVYVLTHHTRPDIMMKGGTTFHFVTGGIKHALEMAMDGAQGKDIRLGGGVQTVRQYIAAKLVDEMHLAVSPSLLGSGENLLHGIDLVGLGYQCAEFAASEKAAHIVIKRK